MINSTIIVPVVLEALLIVASFAFLNAPRNRPAFHWTGMVLLCLTFCWSVVFGCLLAMNDLTLRI
jgi:hypothetical protein